LGFSPSVCADNTIMGGPLYMCAACCRWWSEVVLGVPRWMCFDACPTSACLPYVAARAKALTPNAKLVVMVSNGWFNHVVRAGVCKSQVQRCIQCKQLWHTCCCIISVPLALIMVSVS
jgi:hypothetical protein